ncbi:MAG: hypothetical protein MJ252_04885 [archaeon]|nr:hypothetical protein [archaeon]
MEGLRKGKRVNYKMDDDFDESDKDADYDINSDEQEDFDDPYDNDEDVLPDDLLLESGKGSAKAKKLLKKLKGDKTAIGTEKKYLGRKRNNKNENNDEGVEEFQFKENVDNKDIPIKGTQQKRPRKKKDFNLDMKGKKLNFDKENLPLVNPIREEGISDVPVPFDVDKNYFYQPLNSTEWSEISSYLSKALKEKYLNMNQVDLFFKQRDKLYCGEENGKKLLQT